jgi:hypothetical protein
MAGVLPIRGPRYAIATRITCVLTGPKPRTQASDILMRAVYDLMR